MHKKLLGTVIVNFNIINQLLITYSVFIIYWRKKWEYNGTVHQLFRDLKKSYDSVMRGLLYIIINTFDTPFKLDGLIKM
jgi:hypothetical protein